METEYGAGCGHVWKVRTLLTGANRAAGISLFMGWDISFKSGRPSAGRAFVLFQTTFFYFKLP